MGDLGSGVNRIITSPAGKPPIPMEPVPPSDPADRPSANAARLELAPPGKAAQSQERTRCNA
jgi:hypothetical protein